GDHRRRIPRRAGGPGGGGGHVERGAVDAGRDGGTLPAQVGLRGAHARRAQADAAGPGTAGHVPAGGPLRGRRRRDPVAPTRGNPDARLRSRYHRYRPRRGGRGEGGAAMFFTSQRDNQFFDLIENAARNALELARLLQQAVDDLAHIDRHAEAAEDLEHRGDDYTHRLVELLNRTFVTPLEREELFDLAVTIDSIS